MQPWVLVESKVCCCIVNAFFSRLELIWLTSKICFWQIAPGVNGLIETDSLNSSNILQKL